MVTASHNLLGMPDTNFRGRSTLIARRVRRSGAELLPSVVSARPPMNDINLQRHQEELGRGETKEGVISLEVHGWETDCYVTCLCCLF